MSRVYRVGVDCTTSPDMAGAPEESLTVMRSPASASLGTPRRSVSSFQAPAASIGHIAVGSIAVAGSGAKYSRCSRRLVRKMDQPSVIASYCASHSSPSPNPEFTRRTMQRSALLRLDQPFEGKTLALGLSGEHDTVGWFPAVPPCPLPASRARVRTTPWPRHPLAPRLDGGRTTTRFRDRWRSPARPPRPSLEPRSATRWTGRQVPDRGSRRRLWS